MAVSCRQDGVTIVELDETYNALHEEPIEALSQLLLTAIEKSEDQPRLILDFAKTTYINSRVLEILFRTWKRLKERKGKMVFCSMKPFCVEVLEITHLNRIWQILPDRQSAMAAVKAD